VQDSPLLKGGGGKPTPSTGVNSLSFPVIWAEDVAKILPGTFGMTPTLTGEWWYQWGTNGIDPDVTPASCLPDPDESNLTLNPDGLPLCDDGVPGSVDLVNHIAGEPAADNPLALAKGYIQKDDGNVWQAWSGNVAASGEGELDGTLVVDSIDWGDNLESVDWYTRSQVRTEVVLFQTLAVPQLEYQMRHTSGWGIDEVHGLATDLTNVPMLGPGDRATVYTHCARMTIQKLLVDRTDPLVGDLVWVPEIGWTEPAEDPLNPGFPYPDDVVNPAIFNKPVYEGGDGPGYYSAEINVKGRIIFGYTWNVRQLNDAVVNGGEAAGDYRITFSLDQICGTATLNTFFVDGVTGIMVPAEEEEVVITPAEGDENNNDTGGAVGVLDFANNLTYMDVRILARGGGN